MRNLKLSLSVLFGLMILWGTSPATAAELMCNHISPIQLRFLARHVLHSKQTKNLEIRAADQFIKHLDSSKLYLLSSDVKTIKDKFNGVFDKVKQADCRGILEAYDILKKRVKERAEFAKVYLGKDFKFDPKTSLNLDSKKREFPKNEKEAADFHKKYLQFQIANYLGAGETESSAKEKVIKNYERTVKRMEEEKPSTILATYLDSFANSLDPHTTFWSQEAYEDFEVSIRLSLEGIGATLSSKDGFTVIEQLLPGGAAARSGVLRTKDVITAVGQGEKGDFENVIDMDLREVVRKIRGKKGTKVRLQILRKEGGESKKFQISLVRDKSNIEDEAASIDFIDKTIDGKTVKVGLLNLPSFYADTRTQERSAASDVRKLLRKARKEGADAIVLDLSSNGGGSLQDAVEIAGFFFKEGNVVKQSTRDPLNGELTLFDKDPFVDWTGPLVVLTSRVTASASEIVAGTLKDYKRAVIVGADHTFGKGTVQAVEDLPQKLGGLKTTIGLYFIPGGESTQHVGVESDIVFPSALTIEEFGEKTLDYSLPPKKIKPFLSAEAFVAKGRGAWDLIDQKTVRKLNEKSQARIKKDPDFKKILDDIAKAKKKKGDVVVLSEFVKDKEETQKEIEKLDGKNYEETQAAKKENYMKRADIKEALNIATDLAIMKGLGRPQVMTANKPADKGNPSQALPKKVTKEN